jgi:threonine dehydrogenase-like Zn-dependent dehydrogenase
MDYITTRDITVYGVLASPNSFVPTLRLMSAGKIHVNPLITKIFPFESTVEAFEYVRLNQEFRIKVLVVNPDS